MLLLQDEKGRGDERTEGSILELTAEMGLVLHSSSWPAGRSGIKGQGSGLFQHNCHVKRFVLLPLT